MLGYPSFDAGLNILWFLGVMAFPKPMRQHGGQVFSFVQRSRGVLSDALIRSHFLLKLTNQVPSLCLLPRFTANLKRPFFTVLTTIPRKKHCTLGYVDFHRNFNGNRFSIPRTISVFGIAMRSLKLADL